MKLKPLFIFIITLFCFFFAYKYFYIAIANAHYFGVQQEVDEWNKKDKISSNEAYFSVLNSINYMISLDNNNPAYYHLKGNVIRFGVEMEFEQKASLIQAKQAYLKAVQLRATWPFTWIELAKLNSYIEGLNKETQGYLLQAIDTGPYLFEVNFGVIQVYLNNWYGLNPEQKSLFFEQLYQASLHRRHFSKVFDFAKKVERLKPLCLQLQYNDQYAKYKSNWINKVYCK